MRPSRLLTVAGLVVGALLASAGAAQVRAQPPSADLLLLSLIIEKVTGRSFADVVKRMVFEPAGLSEIEQADLWFC